MPQDQGQLGNLLSFLAELQQGSLPSVLVEKIGNKGHGASVVLRNVVVVCILTVALHLTRASKAVEVLLLLLDSGCSCRSDLLLLLLSVGMMRARLLVHPSRIAALRVELVVSVDVRRGHHIGRLEVYEARVSWYCDLGFRSLSNVSTMENWLEYRSISRRSDLELKDSLVRGRNAERYTRRFGLVSLLDQQGRKQRLSRNSYGRRDSLLVCRVDTRREGCVV